MIQNTSVISGTLLDEPSTVLVIEPSHESGRFQRIDNSTNRFVCFALVQFQSQHVMSLNSHRRIDIARTALSITTPRPKENGVAFRGLTADLLRLIVGGCRSGDRGSAL